MRGSRLRLAVVITGSALVAAGCGGTKTYSATSTRSCLEKAGVDVMKVPKNDFIASTAEGGAFTARFRDNLVTLSFGLDRDGAERIVRGYQRFRGKNIGLEDVLRPTRNVVMLWALHPAENYIRTIESCLK